MRELPSAASINKQQITNDAILETNVIHTSSCWKYFIMCRNHLTWEKLNVNSSKRHKRKTNNNVPTNGRLEKAFLKADMTLLLDGVQNLILLLFLSSSGEKAILPSHASGNHKRHDATPCEKIHKVGNLTML
jgi:hypothetical protein